MSDRNLAHLLVLAAAALAACGESTGPNPGPSLNCGQIQPTSLSPGGFAITDPTSQSACVAVPGAPAAGGSGAEHLYLAVATAGAEVEGGITATYQITGSSTAATADLGALPSPLVSAFRGPATAAQFHRLLRERERALSQDPVHRLFGAREGRSPAPSFAAAPAVGSQKSFFVCTNTSCTSFVTVDATAKVVASKVAIYLDNSTTGDPRYAPPANGFTDTELQDVARVFDDYLYPIDTLNFARESDIDVNGVVQVLLTPRINALSGSCNTTGSVILGYFFALDLLSDPNSNNGEVFYSLVPDPLSNSCTVSKGFARENLAPTFVHEFQHMISYAQHAIFRTGDSEDTWLNEGLSHYAEELAGRLVPDTAGQQPGEMYTQYALSNYLNAYEYLSNPEATFLISPSLTQGTLAERGANWLFVRWAADEFGTTTENLSQFRVRGTDFTRKLVQTQLNGAANVATQSGEAFSNLVPQWQMANYLDDLPGFTPSSSRLQYLTLDLRAQFASLHDQDPTNFPCRVGAAPGACPEEAKYPLYPDSTRVTYSRTGTLRQGSGRHVRIIQDAGAAAVQFRLLGSSATPISATAVPRIGLVRIR
ncbi:MAG TPA: hypothetical protein VFU46_08680 [Gemmatimonadales bacterium]|nr:hypothetical protein [Gemmatimonadales bacterium]